MDTIYKFAVLDPRSNPTAVAANDAIFASGPVLGIEVTIPALAVRCTLGNIDPQHTEGRDVSALEEASSIYDAMATALPPAGATLATVRADLDSIGAMAVLEIIADARKRGEPAEFGSAASRMLAVARADKFARGGYSGRKSLPTRNNPWPEESASAESSKPLAAINAAVADFKVPLAERVATMEKWLLTGEEPASYRASVEKERLELVEALEKGTIKHETAAEGRIAVVESTHRAATMVGYSFAPVVVALNPSFRFGAGEPHRKFTVCAFEARYADIRSALVELDAAERAVNPWYAEEAARQTAKAVTDGRPPVTVEQVKGWGGSPTIGGSPQGVRSALMVAQVVEVVARHLK